MSTPKLQFHTYAPATITIGGNEIALLIKRQSVQEFAAFDRLFYRAMNNEADCLILVRRPGEEMARQERVVLSADRVAAYQASITLIEGSDLASMPDVVAQLLALVHQILGEVQPNEAWAIDDEEIKRRRRLEMTEQERANYERVQKADREAFEAAVLQGVTDFVRVVPGQITLRDVDTGVVSDVTTGAQLLRCIGSDGGVLFRLLLLIRTANTLGDQEKNASGSRSTSSSSSSARDPKATGEPPQIAASAAPLVSVTTGAVTQTVPSPSGSTGM